MLSPITTTEFESIAKQTHENLMKNLGKLSKTYCISNETFMVP